MASVIMECALACAAERAWALLADVTAPHKAFPGVLRDAHGEGDTRVVTFVNGMVIRERIVSVDPSRRRVAYTVTGDRFIHHSAAMQIVKDGELCRFLWTSDFLPDESAPLVEGLMGQGMAAFARVAATSPHPQAGAGKRHDQSNRLAHACGRPDPAHRDRSRAALDRSDL